MSTRRDAMADVYSHLKSVMMTLGRQMEADLARGGMSVAQMILLFNLVEEGSRTPKAMARRLGVTPGNVSRLVEKLETLGYVTRRRSTEDLRVVHIQATPAGKAAIQGGFDTQAKVLTRAFGDWSDTELRLFQAQLARLVPEEPKPVKGMHPARRKRARPPSPPRPAPPMVQVTERKRRRAA